MAGRTLEWVISCVSPGPLEGCRASASAGLPRENRAAGTKQPLAPANFFPRAWQAPEPLTNPPAFWIHSKLVTPVSGAKK